MSQLRFGASNAFDALVYGHTSQGTLDYLRQQTSSFGDQLSDHGKRFVQSARDAIEFFNGSAAVDFARSIINSVKTSHQVHEYVKYLGDINQMQTATLTMQRWMMANPNVRNLYLEQKIDGYYNSYINVHGTDVGNDHYDYRRVMDGIQVVTPDDNYYYIYDDELLEGDRDLTFKEQSDIVMTWNSTDYLLALCRDDPTSPDGGSM